MPKATAIIAQRKGVVELVEVDVPPPGPNEVQVRVHRTLISHGTERAWILARENMEREFPFPLGYAGAGVVEAVGSDVTRFKVGDRIAGHMTHRSLANINENALVDRMPDHMTFDQGSFVTMAGVGLQGVRKARIEVGEAVMVLGLGLIGQFSVASAFVNGGLPVIAVDRVKERLDIALQIGADIAIDNSDPAWKDKLNEATMGNGPAVVIEATGFTEVVNQGLEVVAHFGRVVLQGSTQGIDTVDFYKNVHCKQVSIIGALNPGNPTGQSRPGHWTRPDEVTAVVKLIASGRFKTEPLVTERVSLSGVVKAYDEILSSKFGSLGTIIEWDR